MNGLRDLVGYGASEPSCDPRAIQVAARRETLVERVKANITQHEHEIAKLREIETLLSENPQIEKLISALGNVNIRY